MLNGTIARQQKTATTPIFNPVRKSVMQRNCACGQHTVSGGECAECRKKRLSLQRQATDQAEPTSVPPIVHDVLRSPGQSLDPATRAFMERRFGYDFSRVRVHTDSWAAESARVVNGLAYTVGRDVVFGAGQLAPGTSAGRRLLAHELTHVVQQQAGATALQTSLSISPANDYYEREADKVAGSIVAGNSFGQIRVAPPSQQLQRACGPALIGSVGGCIGIGGQDITDISFSRDQLFLFQVSCDDFLPGEEARLRSLASTITPEQTVEVHGFASEEGDATFNENLSCARALTAADILAQVGVSASTTIFKHGAVPGVREDHRSVVIIVRDPIEEKAEKPAPLTRPHKVKVWINSFIPHAQVEGPPGSECFAGDNRGFSNNPAASSRTHQGMEVNLDSGKQTDFKRIGTTHEIDCDSGNVIDSAKASTSDLGNGPVLSRTEGPASQQNIFFRASASNPLVTLAPAIDLEAVFRVDPSRRQCRFEIEHDGFPAYEAYIAADGAPGITVYTYDPRKDGEGITALFPPMDKSALRRLSF